MDGKDLSTSYALCASRDNRRWNHRIRGLGSHQWPAFSRMPPFCSFSHPSLLLDSFPGLPRRLLFIGFRTSSSPRRTLAFVCFLLLVSNLLIQKGDSVQRLRRAHRDETRPRRACPFLYHLPTSTVANDALIDVWMVFDDYTALRCNEPWPQRRTVNCVPFGSAQPTVKIREARTKEPDKSSTMIAVQN